MSIHLFHLGTGREKFIVLDFQVVIQISVFPLGELKAFSYVLLAGEMCI